MKPTLLVVDDDQSIHVLLKTILKANYQLIHAYSAQEGINVISTKKVNMVLSDIHMPGMSGFAFLDALVNDTDKKNIPVLLMTSQSTDEKRQKAFSLGATDFIGKETFIDDHQLLKDRLNLKIETNISYITTSERLDFDRKSFSNLLMQEVIDGDFFSATRSLLTRLKETFGLVYISYWSLSSSPPTLVLTLEDQQNKFHPPNYGGENLMQETVFQDAIKHRKSYLSNKVIHSLEDNDGILPERSKEHGLPSEIGIPIFGIDHKTLIENNYHVPKDAGIFGFILIKRDSVISDREYKVITKLLLQAGTILWRLFKKL